MEKENKVGCKTSNVVFAFLTGAGIATTAFVLARKARTAVKPSADRILKKCDRAFEALDHQLTELAI